MGVTGCGNAAGGACGHSGQTWLWELVLLIYACMWACGRDARHREEVLQYPSNANYRVRAHHSSRVRRGPLLSHNTRLNSHVASPWLRRAARAAELYQVLYYCTRPILKHDAVHRWFNSSLQAKLPCGARAVVTCCYSPAGIGPRPPPRAQQLETPPPLTAQAPRSPGRGPPACWQVRREPLASLCSPQPACASPSHESPAGAAGAPASSGPLQLRL